MGRGRVELAAAMGASSVTIGYTGMRWGETIDLEHDLLLLTTNPGSSLQAPRSG